MKAEGLSALVIGCGRVGAAWDAPGAPRVLTHAHAYRDNPGIGSLAFVDGVPAAARAAAERWGGRAYPDLDAALAEARPDVASVCVPDGAHYAVLDRLLDSDVRLILAEKPLTVRREEADDVVERAGKRGIVVSVNYSRRFDPAVAEIREALHRGDFGNPVNAIGLYAKGLLHNGSHMVDLLRHLLGEIVEYRPLRSADPPGAEDPTLDCWLRLSRCPSVHLVAAVEGNFSIFELDLVCERARIRFTRFGFQVEIQRVRPHPIYPGYRELAPPEARETGFHLAMPRYLEDALEALRTGRPPACPAEDARATQLACLGILGKHRTETNHG